MTYKTKKSIQCRWCKRRFCPTKNHVAQLCPYCDQYTGLRRAKDSELTNLADELFQFLVKVRRADEQGIAECITCGKRDHWSKLQAGHFRKRGEWGGGLRHDFRNCHPQCPPCNAPNIGNGRQWEHGQYIDREYGAGTAEHLTRHERYPAQKSTYDKKLVILRMVDLCSEIDCVSGEDLEAHARRIITRTSGNKLAAIETGVPEWVVKKT